jgi:steroid delta-isomerase-like uncharacterized protein
MSEDNKAVSRRFFECFASGELDGLDEIVAADAVNHDPYDPHSQEGLEGAKKTISMYREAFPDLRFEIGDQIAEGDRVVTRWTGTGTMKGELMGLEPNGKESTVTGIAIDRIENGKIVESWGNWDTLGLMQNIGAIPEQEPAQA